MVMLNKLKYSEKLPCLFENSTYKVKISDFENQEKTVTDLKQEQGLFYNEWKQTADLM